MDDNRETIANLKFIGKIGKCEKVNISKMCVQPTSIWTSISRTIFNQDNRRNTLSFISHTINRAFCILKSLEISPDNYTTSMHANLIKDIVDSKKGLENLKYTYSLDIKFCCDMDTILQIINANLGISVEEDSVAQTWLK